MTNGIYKILSSKPHNPHYLNRYITFIEQCQQKNIVYDGPTEQHHICPKASDMFPAYKDFRLHPWNKVDLTPRQHFIAHLIIWKLFKDAISTSQALHYMSHGKWKDHVKYSVVYEKLMVAWRNNQSEVSKKSNKERLDNGTHHLLKVPCVDRDGNVIMIEKEEFYVRKRMGCDEFVALSSREGRGRKRGESNRNSKGMVICIEKNGTTSLISQEIYFGQIGPKEHWKYVHVSSNEGIKRKNNGTVSRKQTLANFLNRTEVLKIKELQESLGIRLTSGWHQKDIDKLNTIIDDLEQIKLLLEEEKSEAEIEMLSFRTNFSFQKY